MQIFNTLGRARQTLEPRDPGKVGMYLCGPTVQASPHLGHGRSAVAFDVARRYLEWIGYDVTFVRNITDIEDRIIAAAQHEGVPVEEVAERSAADFLRAYSLLGIEEPSIQPKATEHIAEIQELIAQLVANDHAYVSGGDVYFSVRSYPGYGKLSQHDLDELLAGARVEPSEAKRDPLDFALWKGAKPGEPEWDSPWGAGRPGWHIECSAMAAKYLGADFDIHAGGHDLIFPHHENEIAQSEAATGKTFARYWLHNGMVNLGGEKMAKSTGHVIDLLAHLEQHPPLAVRLFYLRTHYRKPLEYSEEAMADAEASLERLWAFRRRVAGPVEDGPLPEVIADFREALDDDFDVAGGLAVLFDAVREGNRKLDLGEGAGPWIATYEELAGVLGIAEPAKSLDDIESGLSALADDLAVAPVATTEQTLDALVAARSEARARRDWQQADAIRDRLAELDIVVEDTADGARWYRR